MVKSIDSIESAGHARIGWREVGAEARHRCGAVTREARHGERDTGSETREERHPSTPARHAQSLTHLIACAVAGSLAKTVKLASPTAEAAVQTIVERRCEGEKGQTRER